MKLNNDHNNTKLINEALENDITWGDSWAGRIFSSIFRNAKMAGDLNIAIPRLLKQLDAAINRKVIEEVSKDQTIKETINQVKNAGIKGSIIDTVSKNPGNLGDQLKKLAKEYGDDDIENIINSFPQEAQDVFLALLSHENSNDQSGESKKDSTYPLIVRNLKALNKIAGDDLQLGTEPRNKIEGNSPNPGRSKPKAPLPSDNTEPREKSDDSRIINFSDYNKNNSNGKNKDDEDDDEAAPLMAVKEMIIIDKNNTDMLTAHKKLIRSIGALKNQTDKGIAVDTKLLSNFIDNALNTDSKISLKKLYTEIYKYHTGINTGIGTIDPLYKLNEGIEFLSSKSNLATVAEKIARFYKRSIQFEKENLYGAFGDLGIALKTFNESMASIIKHEESKNKEVNELPSESKNESFLNNLFSKDDSTNKVRVSGFGNKVTIIYNGKEFNTSEEMDKLAKQNIDMVTDKVSNTNIDEQKINSFVEKSSIDVIEIVRIFNKANRLIVKNTIPSFRTNGKVNTNRANNWTRTNGESFDPDKPGVGPFRNNKLFQAWNDGVLNIIDKNAKILKDSKLEDQDGKIVVAKYPITKFMTDMLDNDKLFANGNQSKYLHQFFGINYGDNKSLKGNNAISSNRYTQRNDMGDESETKTIVKPISAGGDFTWNRALGSYQERGIYKVSLKGSTGGVAINNIFYLVGVGSYDGYILYKMSQSDEIIKKYMEGYEMKIEENKISHIFFKMKESDTKTRKFNIKKRVMSTEVEMNKLDESLVTEIVLTGINDIRILKENNIDSISYKTDFEIEDDRSYTDQYCLQLKRLLVDDAPMKKESIQFFKDFIMKL